MKREQTTRLGEMLRPYRTIRNQPLREVGQEMGIAAATLMRIEHGQSMDVETWRKLEAWLFARPGKRDAP